MLLFDPTPLGGPAWEPLGPTCKSCNRPIGLDEPTEHLRFDPGGEHRLDEMNGIYHAVCAKPYLSIKRAMDMLGGRFF